MDKKKVNDPLERERKIQSDKSQKQTKPVAMTPETRKRKQITTHNEQIVQEGKRDLMAAGVLCT